MLIHPFPTGPIVGLVSLICLAGACVLLFFVILAGGISAFPPSLVYFLEADTSAVPGAQAISTWTLYNICGASSSDQDVQCGPASPAFPCAPQGNFGTTHGVPSDFIGYVCLYPDATVCAGAGDVLARKG